MNLESSPVYDNTSIGISKEKGTYTYSCALQWSFPDNQRMWHRDPPTAGANSNFIVTERTYQMMDHCEDEGSLNIAVRGFVIGIGLHGQNAGKYVIPVVTAGDSHPAVFVRQQRDFGTSNMRTLNISIPSAGASNHDFSFPLHSDSSWTSIQPLFSAISSQSNAIAQFSIHADDCIAHEVNQQIEFELVPDIKAPSISVSGNIGAIEDSPDSLHSAVYFGSATLNSVVCEDPLTDPSLWIVPEHVRSICASAVSSTDISPLVACAQHPDTTQINPAAHSFLLNASSLVIAACNHTTHAFFSPFTAKNITIVPLTAPPAPQISTHRASFLNDPIEFELTCSIDACMCFYLFERPNSGAELHNPDTSGEGRYGTMQVDCSHPKRVPITHSERGDFVFYAVSTASNAEHPQFAGASALIQGTFERYENASAPSFLGELPSESEGTTTVVHTTPANVSISVHNSAFQATLLGGVVSANAASVNWESLVDWSALPTTPAQETLILNEHLAEDSTLVVRLTPNDPYIVLGGGSNSGGTPPYYSFTYLFDIAPPAGIFPFWWFLIIPFLFLCLSCCTVCTLYCLIGCTCATVQSRREWKRYMPLSLMDHDEFAVDDDGFEEDEERGEQYASDDHMVDKMVAEIHEDLLLEQSDIEMQSENSGDSL